MSKYDFDLFTIGAGSGGVAASRRAGGYGARVAICESDRVGGTCVLRGCVPKKLMVYASEYAGHFEDAAGYGWSVGERSVDWGRLVAAKNEELDRLNGIYLRMLGNAGVEVIEGRGRIVDPHTVAVGDRTFTAERILIATGGWPVIPPIEGAELGITSNEALELSQVPKHLVVVGGGYIGVEFASIYAAAGARVTMLIRGDGVLRGFDHDIRSTLAEQLRARGIDLRFGARITAVRGRPGELTIEHDQGEALAADVLLWATGRSPNTKGLGLDEVGIATNDEGAIEVDTWSQTSVPSVYAVGDATARPQLTPVAIADGRALAETFFNQNPTEIDHGTVPTAVFSMPPVGTIGLTEAQAREKHDAIQIYRAKFRPMKNVLAGRDEKTMMKLVVDKSTDRVLGVHMVGPDAGEIIQGFAVALRAGATKKQFDATVGIHPTAAEEFVTMATPVE